MSDGASRVHGRGGPIKVLRGLVLGLSLSVLNFAGAFLALVALGGLNGWSGTQFMAMFGVLEVATGAVFIIGPNIWRLPVAESALGRRGDQVKFAASTVFIPHWAGGVKCIAGTLFLVYAAGREGLSDAALGLPIVIAALAAACLGVSMAFARFGTMRPDLDVFQVVIRRPDKDDFELPGQSIGAIFAQFLLNITTFPLIKSLSPSVLFDPKLGPSPEFVGWTALIGTIAMLIGFGAWYGRLAWQAPPRQQREAEEVSA